MLFILKTQNRIGVSLPLHHRGLEEEVQASSSPCQQITQQLQWAYADSSPSHTNKEETRNAISSHLCSNIRFIELPLPPVDGLPQGAESTSDLPIHKIPYSASTIAFLGPASELAGGSRQQPQDFTVLPVWMDYPNNIAFKLHENGESP
ncbi:UDP-glycosyltransferase-like protein [Corchorus olitorius]|uniref:UDP-glycosyltransferase-like protein n=1 Tax=Corchorus olitorius TaxID=93759 RepID=A0A1R3GNB3_9ROSI|nr:UDP-glycosyltransferase-like protein [Corchorus olitorius]